MGFIRGRKVIVEADPLAKKAIKSGEEGLEAQRIALHKMGTVDPTAGIGAAFARKEGTLRAGAEDAQRRIQGQMARRGMGGSSIGMALGNQAQQQASQQIAESRAARPMARQQAIMRHGQSMVGAGGQLAGATAGKKLRATSYRKGGMGKIFGTLAGAAIGAAAPKLGTAMGAQLGSSLGGALQG